MKQFKPLMLPAAAVVVLALALLTFQPERTSAQLPGPPQDVVVVNEDTDPVPVAGTVGIDPDANTVQIGNPATAPVPVRDVNDASQPFQQHLSGVFPADSSFATASFQVPEDTRLVIEFVSAHGELKEGQVKEVSLETRVGDKVVPHRFIVHPQPTGQAQPCFIVAQETRLYADPGTKVRIFVHRDTSNGASDPWEASISGYLVDVRR